MAHAWVGFLAHDVFGWTSFAGGGGHPGITKKTFRNARHGIFSAITVRLGSRRA
jgi:hypothetical protein